MKTTKTTLISAQGEVVHIKSKQTGKVILKLKLIPNRQFAGDYDLLMDKCGSDNGIAYEWDTVAKQTIERFERGDS